MLASQYTKEDRYLANNQNKVITLTRFSKISITFPYQKEEKYRYLLPDVMTQYTIIIAHVIYTVYQPFQLSSQGTLSSFRWTCHWISTHLIISNKITN